MTHSSLESEKPSLDTLSKILFLSFAPHYLFDFSWQHLVAHVNTSQVWTRDRSSHWSISWVRSHCLVHTGTRCAPKSLVNNNLLPSQSGHTVEDDSEKPWVPSVKSVVYLLHLLICYPTRECFVCTEHHSPNSGSMLSHLFYTSVRWVKTPTLREGKALAQDPRGVRGRVCIQLWPIALLGCRRSPTMSCYARPLDTTLWEGTGWATVTSYLPPTYLSTDLPPFYLLSKKKMLSLVLLEI